LPKRFLGLVIPARKENTVRKLVIAVVVILLGAVDAAAQVACSPEVDPSACKTMASEWNVALDHMILRGRAISVELLTPAEYGQRVAQIHKEDDALGVRCGGCAPAYSAAPKYQAFDNLWTDDILFLRGPGDRNPFPSKVLVSIEVFADLATDKNGQPVLEDFQNEQGKGQRLVKDHKFHVEKTGGVLNFIVGYFEGMWASYSDFEVRPLKDLK
jgi:hypothetical protein